MSKQNLKQQSPYNNKFDGLMNAAPHKRYKSFAVTCLLYTSPSPRDTR